MQSVLEQRFPHIARRLTEVWHDSQKAYPYLDALLFKESARIERQGFTDDTWKELTFLNELLLTEFPPQTPSQAIDVWSYAADTAPVTS